MIPRPPPGKWLLSARFCRSRFRKAAAARRESGNSEHDLVQNSSYFCLMFDSAQNCCFGKKILESEPEVSKSAWRAGI